MEAQTGKKLSKIELMTIGRRKAMERGVVFGTKKGTKMPKTIAKEAIQKEINQHISARALDIVRATLIPTLGMNFVYRIDEEKNKKGVVTSRKHVLVEDPEEIALALDQMDVGGVHPKEKYYYVTAKAPEYKAGESLLNRAFGKPKESMSVDVEHHFSLKDLGQKADEIEKTNAIEADFTQVQPKIEDSNTPPA